MSAQHSAPLETGLAGRLLVATPELGDGTFGRSVVLVLDHDDDGALGVVINRPTPVDVAEVLPTWQPLACEPGVLFQGGPVALDSALGLAVVPGTAEEAEPLGWRRVVGRLGLVDLDTPPEVLAAEVTRRGGTVEEAEGPWGPELRAAVQVTTPDGRTGTQPSRTLGIRGPRWLLRATVFGRPAVDLEAAADPEEPIMKALRAVVVRRGSEPLAPGEPLPLKMPPNATPRPATP